MNEVTARGQGWVDSRGIERGGYEEGGIELQEGCCMNDQGGYDTLSTVKFEIAFSQERRRPLFTPT